MTLGFYIAVTGASILVGFIFGFWFTRMPTAPNFPKSKAWLTIQIWAQMTDCPKVTLGLDYMHNRSKRVKTVGGVSLMTFELADAGYAKAVMYGRQMAQALGIPLFNEKGAVMLKCEELRNPNSCLNRATEHEWVFVLRAKDPAAPGVIQQWCADRVRLGKNQPEDAQIKEALRCAELMELQRAQWGG